MFVDMAVAYYHHLRNVLGDGVLWHESRVAHTCSPMYVGPMARQSLCVAEGLLQDDQVHEIKSVLSNVLAWQRTVSVSHAPGADDQQARSSHVSDAQQAQPERSNSRKGVRTEAPNWRRPARKTCPGTLEPAWQRTLYLSHAPGGAPLQGP